MAMALDVLGLPPCYARIYATLYKSHEVNWKNKLQIWFSLATWRNSSGSIGRPTTAKDSSFVVAFGLQWGRCASGRWEMGCGVFDFHCSEKGGQKREQLSSCCDGAQLP